MSTVGRALPHDSARGHVTGQASYIDDLPPLAGELQVGFVGSPVAHGELIRIDLAFIKEELTGFIDRDCKLCRSLFPGGGLWELDMDRFGDDGGRCHHQDDEQYKHDVD